MKLPSINIPTLVRIKPGALARLGLYLARHAHGQVVLIHSDGIPAKILAAAHKGFTEHGVQVAAQVAAIEASFDEASRIFAAAPAAGDAVVGLGGGKALDVAKQVARIAGKPYYSVPTSLSNDGFCSPYVSLTVAGRRRSLPGTMPFAVVVDTEVCQGAPEALWHSGVGDLLAKVTAVFDWKLAFHRGGTPVNDFAALLSDATVWQFVARPERDLEGLRVLATALMLNGISIEICGSSRPASGSEHLISHALDEVSERPRLHGLQVGVASYLVSRLQGEGTDRIREVFDRTGFWQSITSDPFSRDEWLQAVRIAPTIKPDFYTILADRDCTAELAAMIDGDPVLAGCFA